MLLGVTVAAAAHPAYDNTAATDKNANHRIVSPKLNCPDSGIQPNAQ
jgi:hypothetical protein